MDFKKYKYKLSADPELRYFAKYAEGEVLNPAILVSEYDRINGSPKLGDMIARDSDNHEEQWLVDKDYFERNFKESISPEKTD